MLPTTNKSATRIATSFLGDSFSHQLRTASEGDLWVDPLFPRRGWDSASVGILVREEEEKVGPEGERSRQTDVNSKKSELRNIFSIVALCEQIHVTM